MLQRRILSRLLGPARLLGAINAKEPHKPLRQVALGSELEFLFTNLDSATLPAQTARRVCVCPRHSTAVEQLHTFPDGRRMR